MKNKDTLSGALKYLGVALLLLFTAPILMTIGFKAVEKDQNYVILIVGIMLGILAVLLSAKGVLKLSSFLFNKDSEQA